MSTVTVNPEQKLPKFPANTILEFHVTEHPNNPVFVSVLYAQKLPLIKEEGHYFGHAAGIPKSYVKYDCHAIVFSAKLTTVLHMYDSAKSLP